MTDIFDRMLTPRQADHRFYGVSVGVVTNVEDPDSLGRVKVTLPWLVEDVETAWARVAAPMAGPDRGVFFPLAVDDEVLVAFEHGCPEFPYVLGGLWNGIEHPPAAGDVCVVRSRKGRTIRLDDTDGEERVEIADRAGNRIVITAADDSITITAAGRLVLSGDAGVEIRSGSSLALRADGPLTIKGTVVHIN